jgi:hypothetical protein
MIVAVTWTGIKSSCAAGFSFGQRKESYCLKKPLAFAIHFLWHCFFDTTFLKTNVMVENNNPNQAQGDKRQNSNESIGNQQQTSQTGAQNAGGENIDQEEDQYTEDLRQSGDRNSSNRKTSS